LAPGGLLLSEGRCLRVAQPRASTSSRAAHCWRGGVAAARSPKGASPRRRSDGRVAPALAVWSTTSILLLFCLQARESWLTAELTGASAAP
jgi:hypothetical protein